MYKEYHGMYAQQREKEKLTEVFDKKEALECLSFLALIVFILVLTAILTNIQNVYIQA